MGDHRAGSGGPRVARPTGKRAARRSEESLGNPTRPEQYVGRRIAPKSAQKARHTPVRMEISSRLESPRTEAAPTVSSASRHTASRPPSHAADAPKRAAQRPPGRRSASRRRLFRGLPSAPVLMGIAALCISVGGALQAVHPGLAGASGADHLVPASALSGSSAVSSASLLGGRTGTLSRDSSRQTLAAAFGTSLLAEADAKVKERNAALSKFAAKAEKQSARIKLNQWVLPVAAGVYQLTARFGDYSPLWSHFHTGLDFAAPTGTPIMAVAGGTITEVGYSGAYGNRTIEQLPDGTELWYCHQNSFGTSVGATVSPGQVIGYVGSTGNVTGPHLHLEVHPGGGDPVDPFTALEVHGLHP
jgi:hypothetical protein